jgi:carbonic anhydrase
VRATLDQLQQPPEKQSRNLASIVDRIRPSVEGLLNTPLRDSPEDLEREAMRANVRVSVRALRHGSDVLERLIATQGLMIVGAEYCVSAGDVEFFDIS